MIVDEFDMDPRHSGYYRETVWKISMRDCDTKTEFKVGDDVMQECIADKFEYISETVCKKIEERVECAWDNSEITDEEKTMFLAILKKVMP